MDISSHILLGGAITFLIFWLISKQVQSISFELKTQTALVDKLELTQTFLIDSCDMCNLNTFDFSPDGVSTVFDLTFTNSINYLNFAPTITLYSSYSSLTSIINAYVVPKKPYGGNYSSYEIDIRNRDINSDLDGSTILSSAEFYNYSTFSSDNNTLWTDETVLRIIYSNAPTESISAYIIGGC